MFLCLLVQKRGWLLFKHYPVITNQSFFYLSFIHNILTIQFNIFQNDLLLAADAGHPAILVLLDLTAAFDTVVHRILLSRLEHYLGISGVALSWFQSDLAGRSWGISPQAWPPSPARSHKGPYSARSSFCFTWYLSDRSWPTVTSVSTATQTTYSPYICPLNVAVRLHCAHSLTAWLTLRHGCVHIF